MIKAACSKSFIIARKMTMSVRRTNAMAQIAPLQKAALEERCILVDSLDRPIGEATKKACHEVSSDGEILLHRAFSVFLFNSKGELLVQKRSSNKVTFPNHYANTCCSHPLAEIPNETVEKDALGVRKAAVRRLNYELGISSAEIQPHELFYATRIYYKSVGDGHWGEHEIDYILIIQKNVTIDPNPDEVSEIRWVSRSEIDNFVKTIKPSPWFYLIYKHKLLHFWWDNLNTLDKIRDDSISTIS